MTKESGSGGTGSGTGPADATLRWPALLKSRRAILVVDMVESVRLMQQFEDASIALWLHFVQQVEQALLPRWPGARLVKSLGDGLMLEFASVADATAAAPLLHAALSEGAIGGPLAQQAQLRCGLHVAQVVVSAHDVYGSGVNLASRLAALAGPGQTVVSLPARDEIAELFDADLEDLGECFVKHIDEPVRAFRLHAPGPSLQALRPALTGLPGVPGSPGVPGVPGSAALAHSAADALRATVAVLPFLRRDDAPASLRLSQAASFTAQEAADGTSLGNWIAEASIVLLSRTPNLRLVSRLSTAALRQRQLSLAEMAACLGADFVLSGTYALHGDNVTLMVELADTRRGEVIWAERLGSELGDLLAADSQTLGAVAAGVQQAIVQTEFHRSLLQAPPTLRSYTLLLSGITMMHRAGREDFNRAAEHLQHLVERHPRLAAPRAWLAQWYVLRVTRGLVADTRSEAAMAMDQVRRALDADPQCSLALTMRGFVECHMLRELETSWNTLQAATEMNPSDSLAWLFKGVVQSLWGQGEPALQMVLEASRLSPLDPMRHYYDALSAPAALAAGQNALAADFCLRSLRSNRVHSPTWRALVIAQSELGQMDLARASLSQLLMLEPDLTVARYLQRSPAGINETRRRYAQALARAGLPES